LKEYSKLAHDFCDADIDEQKAEGLL